MGEDFPKIYRDKGLVFRTLKDFLYYNDMTYGTLKMKKIIEQSLHNKRYLVGSKFMKRCKIGHAKLKSQFNINHLPIKYVKFKIS